MDVLDHNRRAWNSYSASGDRWTRGVSADDIAAARAGDLSKVVLTPCEPIPDAWYGQIDGADILCLASGGGQQGPLLAAAGGIVTVYDMSDAQLDTDRMVAAREGLEITCVQGDMRDLGAFEDASFDLIVHPCSNCFVEEIRPVWREAFRVLRSGGALLSGFNNPIIFTYDEEDAVKEVAIMRHRLPYSDLTHLPEDVLEARIAANKALEFGHTLQDQIGGQCDAGFLIAGFYEDHWEPESKRDRWYEPFIATRAIKP